ncbi:Bug family tripartite tricarboxylate transporter substrate binding protein [Delftia sp. PS-11]|uniref:Bug family tripartite tricarboxylate transporter substrate binding protein n=1 Tax=Delftia sp. PS-11 TaxID=2767222 RepID=UPI002457BF37|nr:tripartite tricarboxylate transporter substrate binding protein [Delftia sp. PS-11]KAJ8746173.1 tripartite tricarboxylate transporter substrate binding protein [Delftia sp. PS-11]
MTSISRRQLLGATAAAAASTLAPSGASAQAAWPSKPVSLVVGYPPGGLTDVGARFITNGMSSVLGRSVVVENRPGASGNIGASEVLRANDAHKLLVANTSFTINPHTFTTPSPNPLDFTPIGLILESQLVLCVNPSSPAKNLEQFRSWVMAETKAGGFSYACAASGGNTHLAMELFRERAELPVMNQVSYKGSAPAIQDVVGNQVPCVMDAASLLIPFIAAGKLRPILVTGSTRLPALQDVPTGSELGLRDFLVTVFVGLWGKPHLEPEIVRAANAALNTAISAPAVSGAIAKNGDMVGGGSPERLSRLTHDNYRLWGEIAKKNNIRAG